MGRVADFFRAKAKREINDTLAKYGELPGFLLHEIAAIRLNNEKQILVLWEGMGNLGIKSSDFKEQVEKTVAEQKGLVRAYEEWIEEFKRDYDNDIPYKSI